MDHLVIDMDYLAFIALSTYLHAKDVVLALPKKKDVRLLDILPYPVHELLPPLLFQVRHLTPTVSIDVNIDPDHKQVIWTDPSKRRFYDRLPFQVSPDLVSPAPLIKTS